MLELKHGQSIELLKELHILTVDGKINQDSRRKLKQVYHLYNFIEPLLKELEQQNKKITLVDHGAGKSYLGFILYDLYLKNVAHSEAFGIEHRPELIKKSNLLKEKLNFDRMSFINSDIATSTSDKKIPNTVDIVTALHACDTATDDAISFALKKQAQYIVLVPCCQAEVASTLRKNKKFSLKNPLTELYRSPLHTREFGSHLTNVLRKLVLESNGYDVTVTELIGFEHSMKNELFIAKKIAQPSTEATEKIKKILAEFKIQELSERFLTN